MDSVVPDHVRRYLGEQAIDLAVRTETALRSPSPPVGRHTQIVRAASSGTVLQHVVVAVARARVAMGLTEGLRQ